MRDVLEFLAIVLLLAVAWALCSDGLTINGATHRIHVHGKGLVIE